MKQPLFEYPYFFEKFILKQVQLIPEYEQSPIAIIGYLPDSQIIPSAAFLLTPTQWSTLCEGFGEDGEKMNQELDKLGQEAPGEKVVFDTTAFFEGDLFMSDLSIQATLQTTFEDGMGLFEVVDLFSEFPFPKSDYKNPSASIGEAATHLYLACMNDGYSPNDLAEYLLQLTDILEIEDSLMNITVREAIILCKPELEAWDYEPAKIWTQQLLSFL